LISWLPGNTKRRRNITLSGMPGEKVASVCLRIPPQTAYIRVAREVADFVSEILQLAPDDRAAIKLAVGEACNNAVLHAHLASYTASAAVEVVFRITEEALEVDVANPRGRFRSLPHTTAMPDPEALTEAGRGIPLMERMVDSVEYELRAGRVIVHLRKIRPKITPPN